MKTYDLRFTIFTLRSLVVLAIAACCVGKSLAQPADEYFHTGAQQYLSNNIPGALQTVTNGLGYFPNDEKLKKLYELLNQQQQQQDQKDQKDKPDKQKQDQKQDQQKQDDKKDQKSEDEQQKKDEEKKPQDKKDQQSSKPEEKKEGEKPQQAAPHQMTPQEAKQLLDAQRDEEKVLMFKPETDPNRQEKKLKDW